MNIEKAIEMIDEYLLEPNNISREWVECMRICRRVLAEKAYEEDLKRDEDVLL